MFATMTPEAEIMLAATCHRLLITAATVGLLSTLLNGDNIRDAFSKGSRSNGVPSDGGIRHIEQFQLPAACASVSATQ